MLRFPLRPGPRLARKERTMKMDDLRDFLELLEEFDEVQRIKVPVDWNPEMGATRDAVMTLARRRRCSRTSKVIRRDSGR